MTLKRRGCNVCKRREVGKTSATWKTSARDEKEFSMLETFSSSAEHVCGTQGLPGDSEDNVLAVGNAYWRLETRARRKECLG